MSDDSDRDLVGAARALVADAARVTVLTGAGISTDSGIPDFRGPNGVWTKDPAAEKASTLQHYLADPEVRRAAWETRRRSPAWTARPNSGHLAFVELERQGKLVALVTQNIDELHQRAGNAPEKVIEVHGTMRWTRCWECGDRRPMAEALQRLDAGDADPACDVCGGILKSDTISFGQALVPEVIDAAFGAAEQCEVLIAAGSSLSVQPVAFLVPHAKAHGAAVIVVNAEPTAMDGEAHIVLRGQLSELLPAIISGG